MSCEFRVRIDVEIKLFATTFTIIRRFQVAILNAFSRFTPHSVHSYDRDILNQFLKMVQMRTNRQHGQCQYVIISFISGMLFELHNAQVMISQINTTLHFILAFSRSFPRAPIHTLSLSLVLRCISLLLRHRRFRCSHRLIMNV